MTKYFFYPLIFIGLLACTAQVSQSTLVMPSSLDYMADKADTIVTGVVGSSYGYWENGIIFTGVFVDVTEYIKNADTAKPTRIELKVMGGQVGETRLEIDHAPVFKPDEEVLLFLVRQDGKYQVYGIYYGVCRIFAGSDGTTSQVSGPVFENREVQNMDTRMIRLNTLPPGGETLDSFVHRIKELVK